jgi:tetratricopeptide (TPR) repeat protein
VAIEGPLRELSIHDVFQLLDLSHKTGTLRVRSELRQNAGVVSFDEGHVVAAEIQSNPHPLGGLLLRSGKVGEEALATARATQAGGDPRRLGEILIEQGAITPRELERQVRLQIEEVVFELLSWSEGYFAFEEGLAAESPAEALIRIPTSVLLMEAARRIDEWSRIEKKIPHLGIVPILAPAAEASDVLDLLPAEWEVLAVVDGQRDARAIAQALGAPEFDVAKTLFGLASAGIILLEDRPRRRTTDGDGGELRRLAREVDDHLAAGDPASALTAAEALVGSHPHQPLAHLARGRALLAVARYDEAAEALWLSAELDPVFAPARRLLGFCLVGQGRFREAVEEWDRWRQLGPQATGEETQLQIIERVKQAALTIDGALRGIRD